MHSICNFCNARSNAIAGIYQQLKKFLCSGPKLQPAGGGLSQVVPVDSECCHEGACRMSPWFHFEAFLLCWPGSGGQCSISERLVACVKPVEINVDSFCKAERSKELSRKKAPSPVNHKVLPHPWDAPGILDSSATEVRCINNYRNNNCTRRTKHELKLAKLMTTQMTSASRASLPSLASLVTSALMPLLLSRTPEQGFAQSDHLVLGSLWVCHPLRARVLPVLSLSLTFSTLNSLSFFRAKLLYKYHPG